MNLWGNHDKPMGMRGAGHELTQDSLSGAVMEEGCSNEVGATKTQVCHFLVLKKM